MASLNTPKTGLPFVKFFLGEYPNRTECRVRLGRVSRADALKAAKHIEALVEAYERDEPVDKRTRDWLDTLSNKIHGRIAKYGICEPREVLQTYHLGGFLKLVLASRDVGGTSIDAYGKPVHNLITYFGEAKRIERITQHDVDKFKIWLETKANRVKPGTGLAQATVDKRLKCSREFFDYAVERQWIKSNPFRHLKNLEQNAAGDEERKHHVDRQIIETLIDDAPDNEWRLLLSLWRFAGLRQTEPLNLTWDDISWSSGRMTIRAHKQHRYPHKVMRVIPIWPEVRPWLEQQFEDAEPGVENVITRRRYAYDTNPKARSAGSNLYTTLQRQCVRCGIPLWPRLTQNLRSSGETDLIMTGEYPDHVIAYWWNHEIKVQRKHYLTVPDEAYDKVVRKAKKAVAGHPKLEGNEITSNG